MRNKNTLEDKNMLQVNQNRQPHKIYYYVIICIVQLLIFSSCSDCRDQNEIEVSAPLEGLYPKHIGMIKEGKKEGYWYYFNQDTLSAQGMYVNDKQDGEWRFYGTEIIIVEHYKNGLKHGDQFIITLQGDTTLIQNCEAGRVKHYYQYVSDKDGNIHVIKDTVSVNPNCFCERALVID